MTKKTSEAPSLRPDDIDSRTCGIIMPISANEAGSEQHWLEVKQILSDSIEGAGLIPNLVSDADDVGVIQQRIVQNLYANPIVVCDVSGKNPNVMFELGLRLAFDKPTIIVKDHITTYSFDTSHIEHLEYPRDLRYAKINSFKTRLTEKLKGTLDQSRKDPSFTTFLKHFGQFSIAKLDTKEVSREDLVILQEVRELKRMISQVKTDTNQESEISRRTWKPDFRTSDRVYPSDIRRIIDQLKSQIPEETWNAMSITEKRDAVLQALAKSEPTRVGYADVKTIHRLLQQDEV